MAQMHYMFRILILGNKNLICDFMEKSNLELLSKDVEVSHYSKRIKTLDGNICDLEIEAIITDAIDYDTLIPTCDGIIYLINPNKIEEIELFELISGIINELEREFPIIVIFYSSNGFCKIPSNFLLEYIWKKTYYESYIFSNFSNIKINVVLECIADAIISGSKPINIETAWLRIPILIEKINLLVLQERWKEAAKYSEILTEIKKKFNYNDYYINSEQTAWLYFKQGDFLKASKFLERGINERKYRLFREIYVKDLVSQGDRYNTLKRYITAAEYYEKAALWSSIELDNKEFYINSINKAIVTWIKACSFQNAFNLIEKLEHDNQKSVMESVTDEIINTAESMLNQKNYNLLKVNLYFCLDRYQRIGLFESVKKISLTIIKVLKAILNEKILENNPHEAILTIEELWSIYEMFNIELDNLDDHLKKIANLFIKQHEFNMIDKILRKVISRETQMEISEIWTKAEKEFELKQKELAKEDYNKIVTLIEDYIIEETRIFEEYNNTLIEYSEQLKQKNQYWEAILVLKQRANWYKSLLLNRYYYVLLSKILINYLESPNPYLVQFIQEIYLLPNIIRKDFLVNNKQKIINAISNKTNTNDSYETIYNLINQFVNLYRNHLLYEDAKDIIQIAVVFIIKRAGTRLFSSKGLDVVPQVLNMLKEAKTLYEETNKKEELNYDKILEEIINRYLEQGDTIHAARLNEQIKEKSIYSELHKKILQIEQQKSEKETESKKKEINWKIKEELLSQLKNQARDIFLSRPTRIKTRTALKRIYYDKPLKYLQDKNWSEAYNSYKEITLSLINQKKIDTACDNISVMALILIKQGKNDEISNLLKLFGADSHMHSILQQTFAYKVLDYVKDMYESGNPAKALEGLNLIDNLPLFTEERSLLYDILGKEITVEELKTSTEKIKTQEESISINLTEFKLIEISSINAFIQKLQSKLELMNRRKLMQRKYWENINNLLSTQNYKIVAEEYIKIAEELKSKGHKDFISLSYILGIICLLKNNLISDALKIYNKISLEFGSMDEILNKNPELILTEQLIKSYFIKNSAYIDTILNGFLKYLPLFDFEKSLIHTMLSQKLQAEVKQEIKTQMIDQSEKVIMLNQQIESLKLGFRDIKQVYSDLFKKRDSMKRIYFKDILENLEKQDFKLVSDLYKSIAIRVSQRNDYEHSGLLILLGSLALFKIRQPIETIKEYVNNFFDKLGFTRNVVDKTFSAKILKVLIDAYILNESKLIKIIEQFLPELPILDQEKILIKI